MSDSHDKLLDHDYDGIRELDNDLPRWWLWLFYLCTIWAVLYFVYYHIAGIGYSSTDQYKQEMNPAYVRPDNGETRFLGLVPIYHSPWWSPDADQNRKAAPVNFVVIKEVGRESDTATYIVLTAGKDLAAGKATFERLCFTCHGKNAEGGIGPNLTDDYWLHGGDFSNIVKTIKFGVPTKGMVAWRTELKPEQILEVASYVNSLHGSNPPNAKAPQGELYKP